MKFTLVLSRFITVLTVSDHLILHIQILYTLPLLFLKLHSGFRLSIQSVNGLKIVLCSSHRVPQKAKQL